MVNEVVAENNVTINALGNITTAESVANVGRIESIGTVDGIKRIDDDIGRLQSRYDSYDRMTAAQIWRKELHVAL